MTRLDEASRDYWHGVLTTGAGTVIPRWTLNPTKGVDEHEVTIDSDLVAELQQLANDLDISSSSVLLSAHARVLAALTSEQRVTTGYVASEGGQPLPCRLMTESDSWRTLLMDVHRVEKAQQAYKDYAVDDLRRQLGLTEPLFETVFDPTGSSTGFAEDTVLWIGISQQDGQHVLRLRYRTEGFDTESAARIAGYHLTALALLAADLDADHRLQSLVSADELHYQIEGLAGMRRELPDRRFHELFEEQVRNHPDLIAAVYDERQWTYQELNARANRLGRALLARGLQQEGIVAVVTERNMDWMAAVLGIFKAGGVYMPIEPHFPADRIASMLSRSECKIVLTETGSTTTLEEALNRVSGVQTFFVDAAYEENHAESDLNIDVGPDQLAYIYFTSGSTGEPKGAMCEHAGMLNHIYAKISDLGVAEGRVVAQTAPQCFDISLWQLVAALLVSGQTLLIKQEVLLDAERFINTLVDGRVGVLQVVPSYLEVILYYLEQHHRELPDLKCVSVTGEAVTKELTERWFRNKPEIKLVNAYGLTETSDDTNHEVMYRPPDRDRVPLGPPINNVYIYVVDESLSPVPLGAIGEIVFSGICVGRGYINDPDRTRLAFMTDPIREGERLYRSGDYGRWQPDGKLEFLGRRDAQVKIRGFRIELGDIENTLLRVPGVRQGAVVVIERDDSSKHLVAFYSSQLPLVVDDMQGQLSQSLPEYMVPTTFHWLENLPLTPNSKVNRRALRALAGELDTVEADYEPPTTLTEQRLAAAWAKILGIPEDKLGRRDHFFEVGGTSLSAVRLAIMMDRAVSLTDVTRYPILAELAGLVDGRTERHSELLQLLSELDSAQTGVLVCFPYAGGNAVNFQSMASILGKHGMSVYAVELPGHDLAAESEQFAPLAQVVDQVVDEITQRGLTQIMLWGHSSGAAFAVETARKLQGKGVEVQQVFVGAQLLGDAADRRAAISELAGMSNAELAAELSANSGYTELGELDTPRAEHIGAAYRHDIVSAHSYFAEALENPPTEKLSVPITVVVAADDPFTTEFSHKYRSWHLLAESVDLFVLSDGGHYFLRARPVEVAQAVVSEVTSDFQV